jgi:putative transposase
MTYENKNSLKGKDVHNFAIKLLCMLPLVARGALVKVTDILNVVIFASAFRTSINQASLSLQGAPCASYVLFDITNQLDNIELQQKTINKILTSNLPKRLYKRPQRIAIDLIEIPYHGTVAEEHEGEVRRSKAKSGTTHFFVYATAYVIIKGNRYSLAMIRVKSDDCMLEVIKKLMKLLKDKGIKVSLLLLDRGFYSVKVIRYLKNKRQAFIMPAIIRCQKTDDSGGPTCTYKLAALKKSGWHRYTLTSSTEGQVTFDVAVVCKNLKESSHKKSVRDTLIYVTFLVKHRPLDWIKQTYRHSEGIESSYRQLHQARIKTTTRNPALRLLFYAIALILRNVWVWLHAQIIAMPRQGGRTFNPELLCFQRLLLWLLFEIGSQYTFATEISVPLDIRSVLDG